MYRTMQKPPKRMHLPYILHYLTNTYRPHPNPFTHTHTHSGHNGSPPLSAHVCKCVRACYDVVFPQIARNTTQLSTPLVVCAYALKSARVCTGLPDCATSCFRGRGLRGAQRDGHRTHRTATTQDENEM